MLKVSGLNDLNILSIDVDIKTSDTHSARIRGLGPYSAKPEQGTSITVYEDQIALLVAKVDSVSYDVASGAFDIVAIDTTGWNSQYGHEIETTISVQSTTNVVSMLGRMTGMAVSGPAVSCYGGGTQTLAPDRAVSEVSSAFGLLFEHSTSTTPGYTLSNAGLTCLEGNNSPCLQVSCNDDYNNHISKIYIQREAPQSTKQLITITNQGSSGTTNVRLQNPNANYEEHGGLEHPIKFPSDYFIDPWTKQFITITVPVGTSIYHTAYDCGEDGYKKVLYYQCNDKERNWKLALYESDPGTDLSHPLVNPIIRLSPGNSYSGGKTTKFMRVEQFINNQISCPDCGGIQIKAYVWEGEDYDLPNWVRSFESGDEGRVDYNTLSSPYYPGESAFVSSGAGTRIARQDSTTYNLDVVKPGIDVTQATKAGVGTYVDGNKYQTTAYDITLSESPGVCQTRVGGEH